MIFLSEYSHQERTAHVFRSESEYIVERFVHLQSQDRLCFDSEQAAHDAARDWVQQQESKMNQLVLPPIPFTAACMSAAIYSALCEDQVHEYVSGQDGEGNSIEIAWSAAHEEWQVITRTGNNTNVYYDHFCETSFVDLDPEMLYDMCDNLGVIEAMQEAAH